MKRRLSAIAKRLADADVETLGIGMFCFAAVLVIGFILVAPITFAQAKRRLVTDLGAIYDAAIAADGILIDSDVSANDGAEFRIKQNGDVAFTGLLRLGTISTIESCLSRDASTSPDKLFLDWNCDAVKNATGGTDCYLDNECGGGGGGGAPTSAEYIVSEAHATLTAEVAPTAANQVPVSSSGSAAAWGTIPAEAIAAGAVGESKLQVTNSPTTGWVLTGNTASENLTWANLVGGGDMLSVDYVTIFGIPIVDFAGYARFLDGDLDTENEFTCDPVAATPYCAFNANEDFTFDLVSNATELYSTVQQARFVGGLGVGNPAAQSVTVANSACIGRDTGTGTTVDRLFEDKDCDFPAVNNPEAGEAFLTNNQKRLTADATSSSTTGAEVTGLKLDLDWIGVYTIDYTILSQSAETTTGLAYGVEYTGTETTLYCTRTYPGTGGSANAVDPLGTAVNASVPVSTGIIDNQAQATTGQLVEHMTWNAACGTPCNSPPLGPNAGVAVANSTALEHVQCNLVTSTAGDLTFYFASEVASSAVKVMANSTASATAFP